MLASDDNNDIIESKTLAVWEIGTWLDNEQKVERQ